MRKNGFTLMELLAVVVILGITFLFIMPSVTSLMGLGERREIELIEERVLFAAKEYVNNYDSTFYNSFYKEGDTNYIYKSDLIKAGLIDENEISKLNTWGGVKGELLSNDRIRYTVEYINAENNEYTNEELYLMIQNNTNKINNISGSNGDGSTSTEVIENLQTQINNLTDKDNANNIFLQNYPVGSIFVTTDSTNPSTKFGGTWVTYGEGRTLVGVDSTQTEFASVGLIGGEKTHTLIEAELPYITGEWAVPVVSGHATYGVTGNAYGMTFDVVGSTNSYGITSGIAGTAITSGYQYGYGFEFGSNKSHNNLQPYITVYMWKRTA